MGVWEVFIGSFQESLKITAIIFVLMIIIELLVLKFKHQILSFVKKNVFLSYVVSSLFGIFPGCVGTFAMDSLYMSGLLGFGGIIAVMIATSGDEAFLLMSLAAKGDISWSLIFILFLVLFLLGIIGAGIADLLKKKTNMKFCTRCSIVNHKHFDSDFNLNHFFKEHVINHIFKKHIWKIGVLIFVSLFVIEFLQGQIQLDFTGNSLFVILLLAALIGVLPISGPNVFLVVMFGKGLIPFSVLLTNSIIQDGHGLLPIMGFSMDDAIKIKTFNFIFGLVVGVILLSLGF